MADNDNTGKNKDFLDESLKSFTKQLTEIGNAFATNINPSLDQLTSTINAFEATAVSSVKALGLGRDRIVEMKASMADARSSMQLMGGDLTQIADITNAVGVGLNRNIILTSESYSKLYAAAEATGVQYATLIPNMKDAGISLYQVNKNMEKVVNTARASGLNVKEVSKNVVDNMGMMDKFNFAGGIQGLAKMVTTATNLRVSVNEIERVMDKAFEPESAIEMAAALQRLGVAQGELLDPLRLMDLAQNDPTELTRQIGEMSKSFVEFNQQTKAFEIAPGAKRQLQEVATALGMQPAAFAKMAKAAAEMDDKLKKISFPDTFTDEQKKFVANMAEMGEGGEYMLRVNGEDMGIDKAMKVFQEQPEVYKKFMAEAQPKTLEQLTKEQLTVQERQAGILSSIANRLGAAVASSEAIETFKDASVKLYETLPTVVSGKQLQTSGIRQDLINKNTSTIAEGFQKGDIIGALGEVKKDLGGYITNAFTQLVSGGGEAYGQLKNSGNPIIEGFTNVAESAVKLVGKSESLDGSFFNLNSKVSETTTSLGKLNTVLTTNENISETNKKLATIGTTNKSGTESTTNEILFSEPLKINISLSGLQPGMSEAELIRMFEEGKLNQLIQKAVSESMKLKVSP